MRHHFRGRQGAVGEHRPIVALEERAGALSRRKKVWHLATRGTPGARFAFGWCMSELDVTPAAEASLTAVSTPVLRAEHVEGELARLIEQQAAKIPSHWFLFSALG